MRVLYVEDDPLDAEAFRRALLRLRPDVSLDIAQTPTDALRQLAAPCAGGVYDTLVVDVSLPEMTGFELLDCLDKTRRTDGGPRIVMFTSSEHRFDIEEARRTKADAYVVKTADRGCFEQLVSVLSACVVYASPRSEATTA